MGILWELSEVAGNDGCNKEIYNLKMTSSHSLFTKNVTKRVGPVPRLHRVKP
jgi:hypothetical protein